MQARLRLGIIKYITLLCCLKNWDLLSPDVFIQSLFYRADTETYNTGKWGKYFLKDQIGVM